MPQGNRRPILRGDKGANEMNGWLLAAILACGTFTASAQDLGNTQAQLGAAAAQTRKKMSARQRLVTLVGVPLLALSAVGCGIHAGNPDRDACVWTQRAFDKTTEAVRRADDSVQKASEGSRAAAQAALAGAEIVLEDAKLAIDRRPGRYHLEIYCDQNQYALYSRTVGKIIADVEQEIAATKTALSSSSQDEVSSRLRSARTHSEEANAKISALKELAQKDGAK